MGKTCVCGADELDVDTKTGRFTAPGEVTVNEGDVISIDGSSGAVYLGEVPVVASQVVQYFEGKLDPASAQAGELVQAVDEIIRHADERRQLVERLILADDDAARQAALDALEPLQRGDFVEILAAMDGLPVTIRLIDPPLHEFLPDLTELSVKVALAEKEPGGATGQDRKLLDAVRRLHEQNPMLG